MPNKLKNKRNSKHLLEKLGKYLNKLQLRKSQISLIIVIVNFNMKCHLIKNHFSNNKKCLQVVNNLVQNKNKYPLIILYILCKIVRHQILMRAIPN